MTLTWFNRRVNSRQRDGPGGEEHLSQIPDRMESGGEEESKTVQKFWNWIRNESDERVLRLDGPIDSESFWGDEVVPAAFREELESESGDLTVWLNSPGGNVFAAAEIYNMLCDYKGRISVKIDSIAASAASVIAMAGDRVCMSPVAMMMVHDPSTIAMGNAKDMERAIATLMEVKESIINAYQRKTGLSRNKISQLMENETWMNAKKAIELGFADEILFDRKKSDAESEEGVNDGKEIEAAAEGTLFSGRLMDQAILNWLAPVQGEPDMEDPDETGETENSVEPTETGIGDASEETAEEQPPGENDNPEPPEDGIPLTDTPESEPAVDIEPEIPVIGMDGKTKDGAMPYDLLVKQLEFLR